MNTLLNPQFIILLFILVRAGDIAIGASIARDAFRGIFYGITAILALIAVILMFVR